MNLSNTARDRKEHTTHRSFTVVVFPRFLGFSANMLFRALVARLPIPLLRVVRLPLVPQTRTVSSFYNIVFETGAQHRDKRHSTYPLIFLEI